MHLPEGEPPAIPMLVFGTLSGAIGVVASLTEEKFKYLQKLEDCIRRTTPTIGNLRQKEYVMIYRLWFGFDNERAVNWTELLIIHLTYFLSLLFCTFIIIVCTYSLYILLFVFTKSWRRCEMDRRTFEYRNFIDGDLIESFIDCTRKQQNAIATEMGASLEELGKFVDELTRIH